MDCLKKIKSCELDLCSPSCCNDLVCPGPVVNQKLDQAFKEQSNYYRGLMALSCPLNSCKTRAQFFSEQSVNSPIYDSRCDPLHLTTILTDSCNRVIQEYCTFNLGTESFADEEVCNNFVHSHSIFTTHNYVGECGQALNETIAGEYPIVSNICYSVILQECGSSCPCFLNQYVNSTHVQLIECLFNSCSPRLSVVTFSFYIAAIVFVFYVMEEFNKKIK